jgi:anti-anti-sigma factor
MFDIRVSPTGEVEMTGRLDGTQCDVALKFLSSLPNPHVMDLARLEYIASAGLRVFLLTQKRLKGGGGPGLKLINVSSAIFDIFHYAGFDQILDISRAAG